MTKPKFTPGPWDVRPDIDGHHATVMRGPHGIPHINLPDAHLIAAAPEMYEACVEALAVVDDAYEATGHIRVAKTSHQRLKIESALAKARGQK